MFLFFFFCICYWRAFINVIIKLEYYITVIFKNKKVKNKQTKNSITCVCANICIGYVAVTNNRAFQLLKFIYYVYIQQWNCARASSAHSYICNGNTCSRTSFDSHHSSVREYWTTNKRVCMRVTCCCNEEMTIHCFVSAFGALVFYLLNPAFVITG